MTNWLLCNLETAMGLNIDAQENEESVYGSAIAM